MTDWFGDLNERLARGLNAPLDPEPIAWVITWAMRQSGPYASAYVTEDEARRAAKNIEKYSDASDVKVTPAFATSSVTSNNSGTAK